MSLQLLLPNKKSMNLVLERIKSYQPETIVYDPDRSLTPASVIIPVNQERGSILFTVRAENLKKHGGQISFPGGRLEPGENALDGALRETEEEIGIPPSDLEITGILDRFQSISDYLVHVYVAMWRQSGPLRINRDEIQNTFEAPVEFFLDASNCRRELWMRQGQEIEMFVWNYDSFRIWGLTARILASFYRAARGKSLSELLTYGRSSQDEV